MPALSGGYACSAEPLFALNCHCRDCQRESGGAYIPVLAVPAAAFALVRGAPRHFVLTADSGYRTTRAFCGDCGSPLFGLPGSAPEMVTLRAGSLDDPSVFGPSLDIFASSAQPWDFMDPDLPKASQIPGETGA